MPIPGDWFAYIIPGFLYLVFAYCVLPGALRENLWPHIGSATALAAIVVAAFFVGLIQNFLIADVLRPIAERLGFLGAGSSLKPTVELAMRSHSSHLAGMQKESYQTMLFLRSTIIPTLLLLCVYSCWIIQMPNPENRWWLACPMKLLACAAGLILWCVLVAIWWKSRGQYHNLMQVVDKALSI